MLCNAFYYATRTNNINNYERSESLENTNKTAFEIHYADCPQIIKKYLNYIRVIEGRSQKTVITYYYSLRSFFAYMLWYKGYVSQQIPAKEINLSLVDYDLLNSIKYIEILEYLTYGANELGYSAATRSKQISAIDQYYKYMEKYDDSVINNPTTDLSTPKQAKREPIYLNRDDALKLLNIVGTDIQNSFYIRDYCILTIFLNCGLRISELVNINFKDINGEELRIHGKGNKERIITLNEACVTAINDYIKVRSVDKVVDKDALFLSKQLNRINVRTVQYMVSKYLKKANLDGQRISPHKLRHTAATLMFQSGETDSRTLQSILGHENLSTTEIYTHVNQEQIKTALNSNPLSKTRRGE